MNNYVKMRRENWKKSFEGKLKRNNDIHIVMAEFISEYTYFSGNIKEIKSRTRQILGTIEGQLKLMPATRKDMDSEKLQEIKLLLENTRKKFRYS